MSDNRLARQIEFVLEIDRLKTIIRHTYLTDESRFENSAEHSWHLAVMALLLTEYADEPVDALRVVKMVLVHDIVEIDAGDTYAFDEIAHLDKAERETLAALRLYGLLPDDQAAELLGLWQEFEASETPDARFANALDRLQPYLHSHRVRGRSWQENGVTLEQVLKRVSPIADASQPLWEYLQSLIAQDVEAGYLKPSRQSAPS